MCKLSQAFPKPDAISEVGFLRLTTFNHFFFQSSFSKGVYLMRETDDVPQVAQASFERRSKCTCTPNPSLSSNRTPSAECPLLYTREDKNEMTAKENAQLGEWGSSIVLPVFSRNWHLSLDPTPPQKKFPLRGPRLRRPLRRGMGPGGGRSISKIGRETKWKSGDRIYISRFLSSKARGIVL